MKSQAASPGGPRIAFSTLGCKLNLYETDALATQFQEGGYRIVDFDNSADVYVINSCTVTNRADRKSRNLLYRARRRRVSDNDGESSANGDPLIVLTGCFVDGHRNELESDGRTLVVPNDGKSAIYDLVEATRLGELSLPGSAGAPGSLAATAPQGRSALHGATAHTAVFDFPLPSQLFHTRTMIKVQDGCDNYCSFCIIPSVRGRAISRTPDDVVSAARTAIAGGVRELVLTGVNMSRYRWSGGQSESPVTFSRLVEQILSLDGDFRLRISSLEPDQIDGRFIELFDHPRMCPHLHLCLQSGSPRLLLAMRRQYTFEEFTAIVERLRARQPQFNITTDIIAGFPGETEADFHATLDAITKLHFGHVHTFPYSERSGTRAERMPGRVPERVRTERAAEIRRVAALAKRRYRASLNGLVEEVLVERMDGGGVARGLGRYYVPVKIRAGNSISYNSGDLRNTVVAVRIDGLESGDDPALPATPLVAEGR